MLTRVGIPQLVQLYLLSLMVITWQTTTPAEIGAYIREQATARGIDPETAWRVANSEGLNHPVGDYGQCGGGPSVGCSFGPYQLYVGGLASGFTQATGLRVQDYENNWRQQVQYALNWASQHGWNPGYPQTVGGGFHGASAIGISNWEGLTGSRALPIDLSAVGGSTAPSTTPSEGGSQAGSQPSTATQPSTTDQNAPPPSPTKLDFSQTVGHTVTQILLVMIGLALLIGGIYLIAGRGTGNITIGERPGSYQRGVVETAREFGKAKKG